MSEELPVFTVGHSTRSIAELAMLLQVAGVQMLVDIRTVPKSRTNPQHNLDALPEALAPFQIAHMRLEELGGLRKKSDLPSEVYAFWRNQSFHNYADYAQSTAFRSGLAKLLSVFAGHRTAIMCAEAVWWRCHRRIVADYLIHEGRSVFHLMGKGLISAATMTKAATPSKDGLDYPAQLPATLETPQ